VRSSEVKPDGREEEWTPDALYFKEKSRIAFHLKLNFFQEKGEKVMNTRRTKPLRSGLVLHDTANTVNS
jgi:hypothetical protein